MISNSLIKFILMVFLLPEVGIRLAYMPLCVHCQLIFAMVIAGLSINIPSSIASSNENISSGTHSNWLFLNIFYFPNILEATSGVTLAIRILVLIKSMKYISACLTKINLYMCVVLSEKRGLSQISALSSTNFDDKISGLCSFSGHW